MPKIGTKFLALYTRSYGNKMSTLQDGIQPMWEDEKNKKGGRWLINLNKQQRATDLDNFWLEMVSVARKKSFRV